MTTVLNPNNHTDIEVGPDGAHTLGVHVTHFIGIDGKDIRVCVCFNADDECRVTVGTAPGMNAIVSTIEYTGEDPSFDPQDAQGA
jgi:hypothetical protein